MSISVRAAELLELSIMLLQMIGVVSLALYRLTAGTRIAHWARAGFILTLFGLATAGAIVAHHDSEFGLFAGGTMTVLLIGMTIGSRSTSLGADMAESAALG
jgi:hypothetical protein